MAEIVWYFLLIILNAEGQRLSRRVNLGQAKTATQGLKDAGTRAYKDVRAHGRRDTGIQTCKQEHIDTGTQDQ